MEYILCSLGGLSFSAITYIYMNQKINIIIKNNNEKEGQHILEKNELDKNNILKINDLERSFLEDKLKLDNEISLLNIRINEQKEKYEQQLSFLDESKNHMMLEFKNISEQIIASQSTSNTNTLDSIINPFKEQLKDFKEQFNTVYNNESNDRAMLKQELLTLRELNINITKETENLTNALKGDNKVMGSWGELILENVLEKSGLRNDDEFSREVSLKMKSGEIFRPDAIVYLPNGRDVIIDAKTSLISYERYINSKNPQDLKEHIQSIDSHIKGLSNKNYTKLEGVNSLDFIFMFLPIESSLTIALEEDPELFNRAYKNNIFLVSPSSLLIALRAIENTWKHKKQEDNVKKIVDKAGRMFDKFAGFVNDIEKLSDQFNTANKSLELAKNKLYVGKGSVVSQMNQLKDMGANSSKNIEEKKI